MKLLQSHLCAGKHRQRIFSPLWKSCEGRADVVKNGGTSRKQFSPLRRCCVAAAVLFMCQDRSTKHFSPLWVL